MEERIEHFYKWIIKILKETPNYLYFQHNHCDYLFCKINRKSNDLEILLEVINECIKKRAETFRPIKNIYGLFFSTIGQDNYILLECTNIKKEYTILDMIKWQNNMLIKKDIPTLNRSNWVYLWSQKIDYLEYQIHELGKKYPTIVNSFSYYDGLAENAISYAYQAQKYRSNVKLVLSHKRVHYPNISAEFDNPLNYVIDIKVRDIGEYIKNLALDNIEYALIDLKAAIEIEKYDIYHLSMLYARLLYPSYYFDIEERIINDSEKEETILSIIEKNEQYEMFLKKAWILLRNYAPIEQISWITKKEL